MVIIKLFHQGCDSLTKLQWDAIFVLMPYHKSWQNLILVFKKYSLSANTVSGNPFSLTCLLPLIRVMSLYIKFWVKLLLQEPVPAFLLSLGESAQHILGGHLLRQAFNSSQSSLCEETKEGSSLPLLCLSERKIKQTKMYLDSYIKKLNLSFQDSHILSHFPPVFQVCMTVFLVCIQDDIF